MKDVIYVEHQNFVSVRGQSLKFVNVVDSSERYIPIDEIEFLVFDHAKSYFSNSVIDTCIRENVGMIFCDQKHSPISVLTSDFGNRKRLKRIKLQLEMTQKVKNRIWRKIIICKINNQSACLRIIANNNQEADFLKLCAKQVDEGDRGNKEAYAARRYFYNLFGSGFKRGRFDDPINAGLNYGYALIRSLIRKELAAHGFEMSIGIHHESSENPFNLSDDIIEAYRPFVDAHVYEFIFQKDIFSLGLEEKKKILQIFFEKCVIDGKVCSIVDAIKITTTSLVTCLEGKSASHLKLPNFVEVGK